MSYSYSAPLLVVTRLLTRSMAATGSPEYSSMPFLSKNSRVVSVRSSTLDPEKILGEVDAVVGQPRLFREHGDREVAWTVLGQRFEEPLADHAVPDHDNSF